MPARDDTVLVLVFLKRLSVTDDNRSLETGFSKDDLLQSVCRAGRDFKVHPSTERAVYLCVLVYFVIDDSGQVSLEYFLLSRYPSQSISYRGDFKVQGYLAHKKHPPYRNLQ